MNIFEAARADVESRRLGGNTRQIAMATSLLRTIDAMGVSKSDAKVILELVTTSIEHTDLSESGDSSAWEPVLLGTNTRVGDIVRVRRNAYPEGEMAEHHNGKYGKITGIRNGACVVNYDDNRIFSHDSSLLERRAT